MTDRWLMKLWSEAVRVQKGDACYNLECRKPAHSVHHIVKRRYRTLRYDAKNGVPLCAACHPIADRNTAFVLAMISDEDAEYLESMGRHTFKEWLVVSGQSQREFLTGEANELKEIRKG